MKISLIIIIGLFGFDAFTQENVAIKREINKIIKYETNIDYKETPGFVVSMFDHDSVYYFSFGNKSATDQDPIKYHDVFELGGTTKMLTGLVFENLQKGKAIDLYSSINNYLPLKNPSFDLCTVFQLLTHTSGLPKHIPGWGALEKLTEDPYSSFNQSDLEEFYSTFKLNRTDTNQYLYSHLNFILLDWILRNTTGKSLQEHTLSVLNLDIHQKPTLPGYTKSMKVATIWNSNLFFGSLGATSNLIDLTRICKDLLNTNHSASHPFFEIKEMKVRSKKGYVAKGMQVIPIAKNTYMYFHTGRTEGHYSFVGLMPGTRTGVIILANSSIGADLLGVNILRMMNQNWRRKE